jgi:hypothetical protein
MKQKAIYILKRFVKHLQYFNRIKKNDRYKNKYSGKCFILGAGPSLKKVDLNLLENVTLFGVNFLHLDQRLSPYNIKFWILVDVFLYSMTASSLANLKKLDEFLLPKTTVIIPVEGKKYILEFNLFKDKNIVYLSFFDSLALCADNKMNYLQMMDLTKPIISYHNIVGFAINCAIYMGFTDLFLLGCDSDWFMYEKKEIPHTYQDKVIANTDMILSKSSYQVFDMSSRENKLMYGYLLYKEYRLLRNAAFSLGVHVFDCTEGGKLDMFPKLALMDALSYK